MAPAGWSAFARYLAAITAVIVFIAVPAANGATVTVTSTFASAGCIQTNSQGPTSASCSYINSGGTLSSAAFADVFGGHLGASASSSLVGSGSAAGAYFIIGLSVQGGDPGDQLLFDLSLNGSFSPGTGAGGSVQMIYDTVSGQNEVIDNAVISCNTYNQVNHGTTCWESPTSGGAGLAGNTTQWMVSLYGVDTITLTGMISANTANATSQGGAFSDFIHSAYFTITAPTGTTINGNPGGALFQTAGVATVPEPSSIFMFATAGAGLMLKRFRRR